MTWPTSWFEKPAHIYNPAVILYNYVLGNMQNYDNSEAVERRVGSALADWLPGKRSNGVELYVMAHSMGNVVVSEALRQSSSQIMDGYAAIAAATVAGSYYQGTNTNDFMGGAESAWRISNLDSKPDDNYDMPPDMYRYNLVVNDEVVHGPTSDFEMHLSTQDTRPYYAYIRQKAGKIINYFSGADAALSAWELNQLSKPDLLDGNIWQYVNQNICYLGSGGSLLGIPGITPPHPGAVVDLLPDCTLLTPDVETVESHFFVTDGTGTRELDWSSQVPITDDSANILSHLIPARTKALGQGVVFGNEVSYSLGLGFTNSNQDHSAIVYGYFGDSKSRNEFWAGVLTDIFGLVSGSDDLSGLSQ